MRIAAEDRPFACAQYQAELHVAAATPKWLDRHMKGQLKCWPNKGGGLNPLDYGLWSQVRESIWADKPATMLELRTPILRHLAASPDAKTASALHVPRSASTSAMWPWKAISTKMGRKRCKQKGQIAHCCLWTQERRFWLTTGPSTCNYSTFSIQRSCPLRTYTAQVLGLGRTPQTLTRGVSFRKMRGDGPPRRFGSGEAFVF